MWMNMRLPYTVYKDENGQYIGHCPATNTMSAAMTFNDCCKAIHSAVRMSIEAKSKDMRKIER